MLYNLVQKNKLVAPIEMLRDCWRMISEDLVDIAIDQLSKRLTLVIRAEGGHIEQ